MTFTLAGLLPPAKKKKISLQIIHRDYFKLGGQHLLQLYAYP